MLNFALWPLQTPEGWPSFKPWQIVTYGFLHSKANLGHIFFNMFGLWMFGRDLERMMGPQRFLAYYMTCVIGAGVVQLVFAGIPGCKPIRRSAPREACSASCWLTVSRSPIGQSCC